jgi:hypothetical protein
VCWSVVAVQTNQVRKQLVQEVALLEEKVSTPLLTTHRAHHVSLISAS